MERQFLMNDTSHKRYIFSLLTSLAIYMIISILYYLIVNFVLVAFNPWLIDEKNLSIRNGTVGLYIDLVPNIIWVFGTWIAVRFILKRPFISIITPQSRIHFKKIFFGFGLFFVLLTISTGIDLFMNKEDYVFNIFSWKEYGWLVLAALILIPIQTTSEEIFFRGLLLQWIGKFTKRPFILALIIGGLFGSAHFWNPEMSEGWVVGIDYVFTGFIYTLITAKTNSLELSIGAHAANNLFLCLFITEKNSVFGTIPSMFMAKQVDPYSSTIESVILMFIFYLISMLFQKRDFSFRPREKVR